MLFIKMIYYHIKYVLNTVFICELQVPIRLCEMRINEK